MFFCDNCENILEFKEESIGNSLDCYSCDYKYKLDHNWEINRYQNNF